MLANSNKIPVQSNMVRLCSNETRADAVKLWGGWQEMGVQDSLGGKEGLTVGVQVEQTGCTEEMD